MQVQTITLNAGASDRLMPQVNAYLITDGRQSLLIDTGFPTNDSVDGLMHALAATHAELAAVILTHWHPDHAGGVHAVQRQFACPIYCHPDDAVHVDVADVRPVCTDGRIIPCGSVSLQVLHTPGHTHGHISLWEPTTGALFCGDVANAGATVWIGPPDGHLIDYLRTLERLAPYPVRVLYPGHGPSVQDPQSLFHTIITRRLDREADILRTLATADCSGRDILARVYGSDLPAAVIPYAYRTVLGHLEKLVVEGRAQQRFRGGHLVYSQRT